MSDRLSVIFCFLSTIVGIVNKMSSFLCFVCHSTVNADTNEDTRDKYREVIGMNLCPDSHLCYICCHFLNKMWLFKSICLKRSLEYPVLFSEKGTINLQRSDTQVGILCSEDICLQQLNSKYHFYKNNDNSPPEPEENNYVQLHEEINFGLLPNNVEVQTDDIFDHFNVNLLKSDAGDVNFNNDEFLVNISKENNAVNGRRDIDEFIFGNDSIESPLENINKIELANLDEMTEVNITLTDLNVRNFEKLHEFNAKDDMADKIYFTNDFVGNPQDCLRNSSEKPQQNNNYVDKSEQYCMRNNYVEKQDITDDIFVEKTQEINSVVKSPELVKNIDYVENPQEFIENDFVEKPLDDFENDERNTTNTPHFNEQDNNDESNSSPTKESEETISEETKTNKNDKVQNSKNIYTKITLTLEEQKMELEANRRGKKYTEAVYKCFNCGIGFLFKDTYQAHMMRHEESNGEHRCTVCTLRFANSAVLRSHRANHAVRYQCTNCDETVRGRHRRTHSCRGTESVGITCHICGRVFPGASHYQQHVKRAHRESGRSYLCSVCGRSFTNQAAVRTHMITHINKKFPCDVCQSTFSSPYTLNQHKKKHEPRPAERHYCATCDLGYSTRKSLLAHQRNALVHKEGVYLCTRARPAPLACARCPAALPTRKGLLRHMRSHNNLGPKILPLCHACGQTFKSASILKRHLKNVCEKDKIEEELSNYYEQ